MASLEIRQLQKYYGPSHVVKGVDLDVDAGEFVVILGPSGCGKSTLLRMVAGLEAVNSGTISINQTIVNDLEPRDRGCAMVFQNYALYPHMTVAENIGYALKISGVGRVERDKRIAAVASSLGLSDFLQRKPSQLSGGQRQRVAMGRAMIREPKIFLYDEPLSNLDAKLRISMRGEIRALHKRLNTTSLFVTHDQIEAMTLADRIVVMNAGQIEQIATPQELYHNPASLFVADFIGAPAFNLLSGIFDASEQKFVIDGVGSLAFLNDRYKSQVRRHVTLGFRAESAAISHHADGIPFTVLDIEDLGAIRHIHGQIGDQKVTVTSSHSVADIVRDQIFIQIEPSSAILFDPKSTRRLP